jgi:hypothetical protein
METEVDLLKTDLGVIIVVIIKVVTTVGTMETEVELIVIAGIITTKEVITKVITTIETTDIDIKPQKIAIKIRDVKIKKI